MGGEAAAGAEAGGVGVAGLGDVGGAGFLAVFDPGLQRGHEGGVGGVADVAVGALGGEGLHQLVGTPGGVHGGFELGVQLDKGGGVADPFDGEHGHGDGAAQVGVGGQAGKGLGVGAVAQHGGVEGRVVTRAAVHRPLVTKGAGAAGSVAGDVLKVKRGPVHVGLQAAFGQLQHLHQRLYLGLLGRAALGGGAVQGQAFVDAGAQVGMGHAGLGGQAQGQVVGGFAGPGVVVAQVLVEHAQVGAHVVRAGAAAQHAAGQQHAVVGGFAHGLVGEQFCRFGGHAGAPGLAVQVGALGLGHMAAVDAAQAFGVFGGGAHGHAPLAK